MQTEPQTRSSAWLWLSPMLFMAVIGAYVVLRYQGQWAEADSATFANVTRVFAQEGRLVPQHGEIYPNGYTFQALSTFLLATTGLEVARLQQLVYPLLATLIVLPAWLVYRELTGSGRGAAIATMVLFTQPEFLFITLRSSHEKFTRALLLLCIFFLVRSFNLTHRPDLFATMIALFYLTTFAFIASNSLLAHSFIFAVAVALLFGLILERRTPPSEQDSLARRLPYTVLTSLVISYIFIFYVYSPVQHAALVLENTGSRIASMFLDVESQPVVNAYAQIDAAWINLPVYFLVSLANWVLLATSFVIWLYQGDRWLRRRIAPASPARRLVWLLYGAFAVQGGLSVISDASGALSSNMQHRIFPSFSIVGVAVVATAVAGWRPRRWRRGIQLSLAAMMGAVACLSVFKATNEPALSNKWIFYRAEELTALAWGDAHLRQADIWPEFDERLGTARAMTGATSRNNNVIRGGRVRPETQVFLLTEITRLRSSRLSRPLPIPYDALRIYDNGMAELYRRRPSTPFQR